MAHPIYERAVRNSPNGWRGGNAAGLQRDDKDRINESRFTSHELRFIYEMLAGDSVDKNPFVTSIHPSLLEVATEAVRYFTNTLLEVIGKDSHSERLIIRSIGQQ